MKTFGWGGPVAACVLVSLGFVAACGSSSTTPTGPKATALNLLNVPAIMKVGTTAQAASTVTFADGTSSNSAATFSGDNNTVATVSSAGLVTAIKPGTVNVTAAVSNLSVVQSVRVVPDVSGNWAGNATVTSCTSSSLNCQATGSVVSFVVNIGQNDTTVPTAFFSAGGQNITLSGLIGADGTLTMSGSAATSSTPGVDTIKIQSWTSTVTTPGVMSGSFTLVGTLGGTTVISTNFSFSSLTHQ